METLRRDLRYTLRGLSRSPGFTAVALLTLALGIGANSAIFSLVHATLLDPLPHVPEPDRLVAVFSEEEGRPFRPTNYADYVDLARRTHTLSDLAAHAAFELSVTVDGLGDRVEGVVASSNYFDVLRIDAVDGRTFRTVADDTEDNLEAVISYGLRQRLFDQDREVIGKIIRINAQPFTVVGVAPRGFRGTDLSVDPAIWIPLQTMSRVTSGFWATFDLTDYDAQRFTGRRISWLGMIGRLAPAVDIETVRNELQASARQLAQAFPETNQGQRFNVVPARTNATPLASRGSLTSFAALISIVVALALLIACANLANLLLARATGRSREIAVRRALGARRSVLIRQLLTESLTLSLVGGGLGLFFAIWLLDLLGGLRLPGDISIASLGGGLRPSVLAVTFAVALLTGITFGLVPAFRGTSRGPAEALRDRAAGMSAGGTRLRAGLVVIQVALCTVLLIGAGLFLRSLHNGLTTDLGVAREELLTVSLDLGAQGYDGEAARSFYSRMLSRIETLPGVRSATLTSAPFGERAFGVSHIELADGDTPPGDEQVRKHLNFTGPSYAETMGLRLLRGRDFEERDMSEGASSVSIVSQAMADRYWPNQNPIGKRFRFAPSGSYIEIVGVVSDALHEALGARNDLIYIYLPDAYERVDETTLVVRAAEREPASLASLVRSEIRAIDPRLPLFELGTVDDRVASQLGPQRMGSILLGSFSGLTLLLASLGIYGIVALAVGRRTREIGIRIALGARHRDVFASALKTGLGPALIGLAAGVGIALILTRLTSAFLYGVTSTDPITYLTTATLLVGIAGLATYLPGRRAARIDPALALRRD